MTISIGSNRSSLAAQRKLAENTSILSKTFERMASGQRINRAADDAAGLAIAEGLRTGSRVYLQGVRNVNDGISWLNIADAALAELSNITSRQIELAEQSANGTYSNIQRSALSAEANALVEEFNRIVQSSEFNDRKIFDVDASSGTLRIQAGFGLDGSIAFSVGETLARTVGTGAFGQDTLLSSAMFYDAAAGDLNGDGTSDLVVVSGSGASIFYNDGSGAFAAAVDHPADPGGEPRGGACGP